MKSIKWFDWSKARRRMVVCKFFGVPISETAETITFLYNGKETTIEKDCCIITDF